jgi:hypothetical protein
MTGGAVAPEEIRFMRPELAAGEKTTPLVPSA